MAGAKDSTAAFRDYLRELQGNLSSGIAREQTHRPALKSLLEALDSSINAFNDPKHIDVGAPDFTVRRKGHEIDFPVGWVETKDIGEDLAKIEKSEQLKRYLGLPNLILTDYLEFRWYVEGKRRLTARLASAGAKGKLRPETGGEEQVATLLTEFLGHSIASVDTPKELAGRMARLTHIIRDILLNTFQAEGESGQLHSQFQAFRETLIPDLDPGQFADMYAQTIAYGLFAARCQPGVIRKNFSRAAAADLIPRTNPFLRRLFREIAFELDERVQPFVDDLVALLRNADINTIMADFGKRTAKEDPVVHFYEDFLKEYDPKVREMRGVYYTPEPVVSYIVRSVDHLLKTKFNKPDGLADKDVLILDPACGTGTFLYYVIRHIYHTLVGKGQKGQWSRYVSENLLKRVFGFELLMAPYAVAHLKLGLLLQDLGYQFDTDERLGVFLTNTLEEAVKKSEAMFAQWIADEANAAADIKRDKPIMVVLGNPPYSGHSANRSWVMKNGKKELTFIGNLLQDYYKVDGKPLGERNPKWLQDDYVKFIRFGQWRIEKTGHGILAFISNNGYLDNPTFRGMRQQLMRTYPEIHILDLHGSSKKKERTPDGGKDENVFDIQQGVAIGIFAKEENMNKASTVHDASLWGVREEKYHALESLTVDRIKWEKLAPISSNYLFVSRDAGLAEEYERGWKITEIFPMNSVGIVTARDDLTIGWTPQEIWDRVQDYVSIGSEDARRKYNLGKDVQDWKVHWAQEDLRASGPRRDLVAPILYRPFDVRHTYFTGRSRGFMCRPRSETMNHIIAIQKPVLISARSNKSQFPDHFFCSRFIVETKCAESTTQSAIFPLYLRPEFLPGGGQYQLKAMWAKQDDSGSPVPNLAPKFLRDLQERLAREKVDTLPIEPETVFFYLYSILYSAEYRQRYLEFLRLDFPRVPLTSDKKLFRALVEKGRELVALHLMESPKLSQFITTYPVERDHTVEKVRYDQRHQRVYINLAQYFEGVPPEVWDFHIGGYQVCEKWLKDRKGRQLSSDDLDHYQKIVVALAETIRLMREIDEVIPGWPLP